MISKKKYLNSITLFIYDIFEDLRYMVDIKHKSKHITKELKNQYYEDQISMVLNLQMCMYDVCKMTNEERKKKWKELKKSELNKIKKTELAVAQIGINHSLQLVYNVNMTKDIIQILEFKKFLNYREKSLSKQRYGSNKLLSYYIHEMMRKLFYLKFPHTSFIDFLYYSLILLRYDGYHKIPEEYLKENIRKQFVDPYLQELKVYDNFDMDSEIIASWNFNI